MSDEDRKRAMDFIERMIANRSDPKAEKNRLLEFLREHDSPYEVVPQRDSIDEARKGLVDAALDKIIATKAKLEAAFPGEEFPIPIWSDKTVRGEKLSFFAYDGSDKGGEAIFGRPKTLLIFNTEEMGAIYAHEGGHDLKEKGFAIYETARQQECAADHTARNVGAGAALKSALEKLKKLYPELADNPDPWHPSLNRRIAALDDETFAHVSSEDLDFDEECHASLKAPIPRSKPKPRQK